MGEHIMVGSDLKLEQSLRTPYDADNETQATGMANTTFRTMRHVAPLCQWQDQSRIAHTCAA